MINEETIYETNQKIDDKKDVIKDENPWKLVTLGGVTGVFMGAGLLHAGQTITKDLVSSEEDEEIDAGSHTIEDSLKVANVGQGVSFGQAFAAARAEVGPGGVFYWHGGIYNTYTAEEWNSMSRVEKKDFAQKVQPEIHPNELSTPTDANPQVVVVHHVYHHLEVHQSESATEDVQIVAQQADNDDIQDGDVHIVGFANFQGHLATGLDMNGDGMTDVAIIDVDDNLEVSRPDLVIDRDGNTATVGDIVNVNNPTTEQSNISSGLTDDPSAVANYTLYDI